MQQLKQTFIYGSMLCVLAFTACNDEKKEDKSGDTDTIAVVTPPQTPETNAATATLTGTKPDTTLNGTAEFTQQNGKVKLVLNITCEKMAGKSVAVHIHEMGDCGDMGNMAHGHWNPTGKQHGKWGSDNFHLGDIGNVSLDAQGKGMLEMETDLWTIGGDSTSNLLNRAFMVHSGKDDFKTQPTGNAGSRIGCGVIKK
jgi:Cu-Zn family superoxide dismutase